MDNTKHILLAEDDLDFGHLLKQYLEISDFKVTWANDGKEALELFKKNTYNICVLDVMMPKLDGFTLAEQLIELNPETPFIFLTARKLKEDKIKGLKLGADDYIVKPFEADELILRLNNILKRASKTTSDFSNENIIQIGSYQFNSKRLELIYNSKKQQLTEKEAALILILFQHKNQLLKREDILNAVWNQDDFSLAEVWMSLLAGYANTLKKTLQLL